MLSPWFDNGGLFAELEALRRQMDNVYERNFGDRGVRNNGGLQFRDEDGKYVLTFDIPGVSADAVELTCTRNQLTVQAERKVEAPENARTHHRERRSWRFSRTLNLPDNVDADNVSADVSNGVLTLTLPQRPEAKPRRIDVSAS